MKLKDKHVDKSGGTGYQEWNVSNFLRKDWGSGRAKTKPSEVLQASETKVYVWSARPWITRTQIVCMDPCVPISYLSSRESWGFCPSFLPATRPHSQRTTYVTSDESTTHTVFGSEEVIHHIGPSFYVYMGVRFFSIWVYSVVWRISFPSLRRHGSLGVVKRVSDPVSTVVILKYLFT